MNFLIVCDDMETSEIRSLSYFTFPFLSVLEKHSWASFGDSLRIAPFEPFRAVGGGILLAFPTSIALC